MKRMKRNRQQRETFQDEADSEGSWAISYGDMVTLLLCFFILFFTVDPERSKSAALQQAMMNVFITPSPTTGGPATSGPANEASAKARAPAAEAAGTSRTSQKGEVADLQTEITETWGGKVHKIGSQLVIEFPGVSFFKSGETQLTQTGIANLQKFTTMYVPFAGKNIVSVQAYTDMKAVRLNPNRKYSDNLELSALRSVSTMRVLQHAGIPLVRMRVAGFGEMRSTARELASVQADQKVLFDLARKVVIVIQPEGKIEP